MAIHNGKFFDVEVTRAFFTDLADGYNEFNRNAKIHRGTLEDFVNTDAWQGKDAENAKKLMKANKITLLNEVLDLQAEATKLSEHILDKFRIEVDNAPDARIEYDTLWQINDDYKNLYFDYMDIHNDVESIASDSQLRFSRYGNIRIPESTNCEKAFAKLCGSDDDNAGFIYECIQKLIRFDSETEALINDAALGSKAEFLLNRMRTKDSAVNVGRLSSKSDFASGFDISDVRFGRRIVSARFNGRFLRNRFKDVIYIDDEQVPLRGGKRFSKSLRGMFTKSVTKSTSKTKSKSKSKKDQNLKTIEAEAEKLDYQMNLLCDDNDSNDAEAIENINEILKQFITTETIDGTEYVVYDQAKIQSALQYLDEKGLAGQLLYSLNEKIESDGTKVIGKLSWNADAEDTYLEVEKYGPGAILTITSDYNFGPFNELDGEFLAYVATQDSAKNYFMNNEGDHWGYDWDAIKDWSAIEDVHLNGQEIEFLKDRLLVMSDENFDRFLSHTQQKKFRMNWDHYYSTQIGVLMSYYASEAIKMPVTEKGDPYTRALYANTVISFVNTSIGNMYLSTKPIGSNKEYTAELGTNNSMETSTASITVYPIARPDTLDAWLDDEVKEIISPDGFGSVLSTAEGCGACFVLTNPFAGSAFTIATGVASYAEDMMTFKNVETLLDLGNNSAMYGIQGNLVVINIGGQKSANIAVREFDEYKINAATIYYNSQNNTNITTDQLKESFAEDGTIRNNYKKIYYDGTGEGEIAKIEGVLNKIAEYECTESGYGKTEELPPERMELIADIYSSMEMNLSVYCVNNKISADSLEDLEDYQLQGLYYFVTR